MQFIKMRPYKEGGPSVQQSWQRKEGVWIGGMLPQVKECLGIPETGKGKGEFSLRGFGGIMAPPTP